MEKQNCIMEACDNKADVFFLNVFEVKKLKTFALLPICSTCENIVSDESCEETCSIRSLVN
jgi:hypothetical protein